TYTLFTKTCSLTNNEPMRPERRYSTYPHVRRPRLLSCLEGDNYSASWISCRARTREVADVTFICRCVASEL
ncbi:unnamed protein product, partial [Allacma fusca]